MAENNVAPPSKAAKPFLGSREDARAAGAVRYIDGMSCKRGHPHQTIWLTSNRQCVTCRDLTNAERSHLKPGAFSQDLFVKGIAVFVGSWASARRAGAMYYSNPRKLCQHGHEPSIRLVSSAACVSCSHEYHETHSERLNGAKRQQRRDNPELFSERGKARYAANPEYFKGYAVSWAARNEERKRGTDARWREDHADYLRAYYAAWAKAHPEKMSAKAHKRRAAKLGSTEHFTAEDVMEIFVLQRGRCAYCRVKLDSKRAKDHVVRANDHIIPLNGGGSNARQNIQILCQHCNSTKSDKDPIDFVRQKFGWLI